MLEEIKRLEQEARALDPPADQIREWNREVTKYAMDFLDQIDDIPVFVRDTKPLEQLDQLSIIEEGRPMKQLLDVIEQSVDRVGINPAAGGHLGYVPGGGLVPTAYGDFLAAITNRYAGIYYANPGAVHMENLIIQWMARLMGYPADAAGNLTSGGSIGTLVAMVSAREHQGVTPDKINQAVIYLTAQIHHCIVKALSVIGFHHAVMRIVPMKYPFRMDVEALKNQIIEDRRQGLKPFMICASAGSTDVGAIDPLDQIADVAEAEGCWFHVDAAYGGFFLLLDEFKEKFRGISRSDSVVLDPHKGLFVSYGTGAVLVRHSQSVLKSHFYEANYMQDATMADRLASPANVSPELTKHFRGLRIWLNLQLFGLRPIRAALREKLLLATYFHRQVAALGFEVGPAPELSVVIFRYVPERGDANAFNAQLTLDILDSGEIFLSSTTIDGVYWLRICVMVFRTHQRHLDKFLTMLGKAKRRAGQTKQPS